MNHSRRSVQVALATALVTVSGLPMACGDVPETDPKMVSVWMHTLYGLVRAERLSPPLASRVFAYASTALYFGLSSLPKQSSTANLMNGLPDLPRPKSVRGYDATITAVAAERVTLDSLLMEALPTTRAAIGRLADSLSTTQLAFGVSESVRSRSELLGRQIGLAIVAWAHADGFDSTRGRKYVPPVGRGLWVNDSPVTNYATQNLSGASELVVPDNPANARRSGNSSDRGLILSRPKVAGGGTMPAVNMAGATEPYWGDNRFFVLEGWQDCPVPALAPFSTSPGTQIYEDANVVFTTGRNLTAEQRLITLYWADNAGETGTPTGHWLSIASQMVSAKHLPAQAAARLMMLTSVAMADAFIATWAVKFRINLIRPRTYVRSVMDPTWEPAIPTPPFPEYVSAHSAVSAAAAAALTSVLGGVAFEDSTGLAAGNGIRRFDSFRSAASEAGMSRIFGGLHFPHSNTAGRALGECVGAKVVARLGGSAE